MNTPIEPWCAGGCEVTTPHHHEVRPRPNGDGVVDVVVHHVADPNAEVRDPDSGEVIFPATKAPFKLIEGGKETT